MQSPSIQIRLNYMFISYLPSKHPFFAKLPNMFIDFWAASSSLTRINQGTAAGFDSSAHKAVIIIMSLDGGR